MPAADLQGSTATYGRSILSLRREHQVHSMDVNSTRDQELESFQNSVTARFLDLSLVSSDEILSLDWVRKILDAFLCCLEEFRAILFHNRSVVCKSPLDRFVQDYFERSLKALDVCNAIRGGLEQIREWKKLLEIVLCALDCNNLYEGQFRRAKKALIDLSISMIDEKENSNAGLAHRNWSFGRQHLSLRDHRHHRSIGHSRSLSWSVSRSWSTAKQLQAFGNNLVAPRGNEVMATNGVGLAVYTMNSVLLFVMWVLVAALPCQDRGLQVHFSIPRQFHWAAPILSMHEKVLDLSRRRDRKNACGLLREIHQIDKTVRIMNELSDSVQFPLVEEKEGEVRKNVKELRDLCGLIKDRVDPLERQVREVFHKIVQCRTEGLYTPGRANHND